MSATVTLSMPTLLLGVPVLVAFSGAVTFYALRAYLNDAVDGHRQLAVMDDQSARWLWSHGYRSTPHAGPDVTADDEDAWGGEQPGEAASSLLEPLWRAVAYVRRMFARQAPGRHRVPADPVVAEVLRTPTQAWQLVEGRVPVSAIPAQREAAE